MLYSVSPSERSVAPGLSKAGMASVFVRPSKGGLTSVLISVKNAWYLILSHLVKKDYCIKRSK